MFNLSFNNQFIKKLTVLKIMLNSKFFQANTIRDTFQYTQSHSEANISNNKIQTKIDETDKQSQTLTTKSALELEDINNITRLNSPKPNITQTKFPTPHKEPLFSKELGTLSKNKQDNGKIVKVIAKAYCKSALRKIKR